MENVAGQRSVTQNDRKYTGHAAVCAGWYRNGEQWCQNTPLVA